MGDQEYEEDRLEVKSGHLLICGASKGCLDPNEEDFSGPDDVLPVVELVLVLNDKEAVMLSHCLVAPLTAMVMG